MKVVRKLMKNKMRENTPMIQNLKSKMTSTQILTVYSNSLFQVVQILKVQMKVKSLNKRNLAKRVSKKNNQAFGNQLLKDRHKISKIRILNKKISC